MALEVTGGVIRDGSGNEDQIVDLIDGRAKAWASVDQTSAGHPTYFSFNISSTTDQGSGKTDFVFNNAFSAKFWPVVAEAGVNSGQRYTTISPNAFNATDTLSVFAVNTSDNNTDASYLSTQNDGTLA